MGPTTTALALAPSSTPHEALCIALYHMGPCSALCAFFALAVSVPSLCLLCAFSAPSVPCLCLLCAFCAFSVPTLCPKGSGLKKPNFLGNNSLLELWIDQTQVADYLASYVR